MSMVRPYHGGRGDWLVKLICCGMDGGSWRLETWEAADKFREDYCHKSGPQDHDRQGIIEHSPRVPA